MPEAPLTPIDRDLWVAARPLPLIVGDVGCRMSVVRLAGGGLFLHSPVPLDAPLSEALDALGPVRWIVGPSRVHHLYLGDYAAAWPQAELCVTPGLERKRRDLKVDRVLDDAGANPWQGEIRFLLFRGAPGMNETVFLHEKTRTLLLADLVFNVTAEGRNEARLFHRLVGATGRFGPHRLVRLGIRDGRAARRSLDAILGWDFDRIVMSHGEVLESGGRAALAAAFAYLPLA